MINSKMALLLPMGVPYSRITTNSFCMKHSVTSKINLDLNFIAGCFMKTQNS